MDEPTEHLTCPYNGLGNREAEAMDQLVFSSIPEVMATFGRLTGRPQVHHLPIDEVGLNAWLGRQKDSDPLQRAHAWGVEYKARQLRKA